MLNKEIDLFTSGGGRGEYLQAAYSYLGTILPTSVDCERCFSTAPFVDYKIRSDGMLDALIFRDFCIPNLYRNIPGVRDWDYEITNSGIFKNQSRLASLICT